MDKVKALEIISMIVDGCDPYGEKDPVQNLPEFNPITIRALCIAIESLLSRTDKASLMKDYRSYKHMELFEIVEGPLKKYLLNQEKDSILRVLYKSNFDVAQAANEINLKPIDFEQRIEMLGIRHEIGLQIIWKIITDDYNNVIKKKGLDYYLELLEANTVKKVLDKTNFDRNQAADILGITLRSLRYRIQKLFGDNEPEKYISNDDITLDFFKYSDKMSLDEFIQIVEKKIFELALEDTNFVKDKAAYLLGITLRSFRYKIEKIGIESIGND